MKTTITSEQARAVLSDQSEHALQAACVRWFRLAYPQLMLAATPNGAKRTKGERGYAIKEGMIAGWPDLLLAYPSGEWHGLFIEMKTLKGRLSDQQIMVHAYLTAQGYWVGVPRTFEQFQELISAYLKD